MKSAVLVSAVALIVSSSAAAEWSAPRKPAIPRAGGYVTIPNASFAPSPARVYRALFDATHAAPAPDELLPALDTAGKMLNGLVASGVPLSHARLAVVFHGDALDGLLADARYRAKFGVPNPNLEVLALMKKAGIDLFVCGQSVVAEGLAPDDLSADVAIASDAAIVQLEYQSRGYAVLAD